MAKPKRKYIINEYPDKTGMTVYCNNHNQAAAELNGIEGISQIGIHHNCLMIYTDPRYDIEDITAEIKQLLEAEVPQVFKE